MADDVPRQPLRIPAGWVVEYNQLFELDPSSELDSDRASAFFKQDLLQLTNPRLDWLVDVGWYPDGDMTEGAFRLVVQQGDFRGERLHEFHTSSRRELVLEMERVLHAYTVTALSPRRGKSNRS